MRKSMSGVVFYMSNREVWITEKHGEKTGENFMGKDYSDSNRTDGKGKMLQGVMDGAPAYQVDGFPYLISEAEENTVGECPTVPRQTEQSGYKTIADYLALPEDRRVELIEGVFYDMAAPSYLHQIISGEIFAQLRDHIQKNGGSCLPFIAPADVQLFCDDKTMVQPDVFVVCNRDKITRQRVQGAPDLIVEVASQSNWRIDAYLKVIKYREAGVREYWIVFPDAKKVVVYLFEKNVDVENLLPIEYTFADKVPVGIWENRCEVDFADIYERCSFLYA